MTEAMERVDIVDIPCVHTGKQGVTYFKKVLSIKSLNTDFFYRLGRPQASSLKVKLFRSLPVWRSSFRHLWGLILIFTRETRLDPVGGPYSYYGPLRYVLVRLNHSGAGVDQRVPYWLCCGSPTIPPSSNAR